MAWNKNTFGHIQKNKQRILNRLHGIHLSLGKGPNLFLEDLQKCLWWDYEVVLFEEEALWAQKSRCHLALLGGQEYEVFSLIHFG